VTGDQLVRDYLADLEEAATVLHRDLRDELVRDVREHITIALADADDDDEPFVRAVLDRLGTPDAIVGAAMDGDTQTSLRATERGRAWSRTAGLRPLTIEERAMLALTVGSIVLPFVGPVLGLWLASASSAWSLAQKRTAAAIVLVLLALPAVLVLPGIAQGELNWVVGSAGFLLPFVPASGLLAAAYLHLTSSFVVTVGRRV
jgi:uncharacterized membrane protein